MWVFLLHDAVHREKLITSRSAQHALRLIHHNTILVLVKDLKIRLRFANVVHRVGFHIHPSQHVPQDGLTLSPACGIVQIVAPNLVRRGLSPPEFRHGDWLVALSECVLKQLGRRAIPGARRRPFEGRIGEHRQQGLGLAQYVEKHVPIEQFVLQMPRLLPAFVLQVLEAFLYISNGALRLLDFLFDLRFQLLHLSLNRCSFLLQLLVHNAKFFFVQVGPFLLSYRTSLLLHLLGMFSVGGQS
mmetsp:Transcript_883/g.2139  ORF Transcript_883/g.2139 Transcript_883/m.2139 type:complete len:243 (+) Transcript_883:1144-1872(+)